MDANYRPTVVFDISSDEERPIEEAKVCDDDYNWLTEVLRTFDNEKAHPKEDNDDDDVVVIVSEYNLPKPKSKPKSKSTNQEKVVKVVDDGDDDCIVLDGDPDNSVAGAADAASDGDDVLVVAEKGQVACRDFPHPRHFCVEFPFSSTPHERYCHMCHCYVCDSLAPCVRWGTGASAMDHCHATDKQEMWKTQREIYRTGKDGPTPVSKLSDTSVPMAVPQLNQATPVNITRLTPIPKSQNQLLTQNPMPLNQVSRTPTIHGCSSSRLGIPNIIGQGRNHQPGYIQGRNRLLPRSVSQQALGVRNVVEGGRGPNTSNLGQRFVPSRPMFKRSGLLGRALVTNRHTHVSSDNMNRASDSRYSRNVASPAVSKENPTTRQDILASTNFESHAYQSSSQPNMGSVGVNIEPPSPEAYSQPMPLLNDCQSIYQLENQGQNVLDSGFFDFDFHQVNNTSQNDQQDAIDNVLHGIVSNNEPSTAQLFTPCFAGSESAQLHCRDHGVDSMFLNHAVPVPSEGCMPHDLINVFSPESSTFDTGMYYFDFETSWNDLTHA